MGHIFPYLEVIMTDGQFFLALFIFLLLGVAICLVLDSKTKKKHKMEYYTKLQAGEVFPMKWATSAFSPSVLLGISPNIFFSCGACQASNQMKVPMSTVPANGGLRLRCQCCGKPNRLPIRRL